VIVSSATDVIRCGIVIRGGQASIIEYEAPSASIRITRASRILRADLATPQTGFELRAFIMREKQRHMAQQRTPRLFGNAYRMLGSTGGAAYAVGNPRVA
jgi:hypothetical protein